MASESFDLCPQCQKAKAKTVCLGCRRNYCTKCYRSHRQVLDQELDEIILERDRIKSEIDNAFESTNSWQLLKSNIDQWEQKIIEQVKSAAENARQNLESLISKAKGDISENIKQISTTLLTMREEEDYVETDLADVRVKLQSFSNDLDNFNKLSQRILIKNRSDQIGWDKIISIDIEKSIPSDIIPMDHHNQDKPITYPAVLPNIPRHATWSKVGTTIMKDLKNPYGLTIDLNSGIVFVADTQNNRIVSWNPSTKETSSFTASLKMPSDVLMDYRTNSLLIADNGNRRVVRWPLQRIVSEPDIVLENIDCWGLATDKDGALYVTDKLKHEVRRFEEGDRTGRLIAGGKGNGSNIDQLNWPRYIVVDDEYTVYISDWNNHRVVKWTKGAQRGILVAGGRGPGPSLTQLTSPAGIALDSQGTLYTVEESNYRVTRWRKGETAGDIIVGGNGRGGNSDQLGGPFGLCFDKDYNLYVVEYSNQRVQQFSIK